MPHVSVPNHLPGIVSLFAFRPAHAPALNGLAQTLLRGDSPLTPGERELIATHVSGLNKTPFCQASHAAAATSLLGDRPRVQSLMDQGLAAAEEPKLKTLLAIAEAVTLSPQGVTPALVEAARAAGNDEVALHDAVLIAAAFCMFNRYVDGLATVCPPASDVAAYAEMGDMLATRGYVGAGEVVTA